MIFAELLLKKDFIDGFSSLLWQLATGHAPGVNPPMWYMACLIWLTILYYILFKLCGSKADMIIIILAFMALALQYAGINYAMFHNLPYELKYPLGRMLEMVPYASLGVILGKIERDREIRVVPKSMFWALAFILDAILVTMISTLNAGAIPPPKGFGYSGFTLIVISTLTFHSFWLMPIHIINKKALAIVTAITAHTLGVYIMHYTIGNFIKMVFQTDMNLLVCAGIYLICYILCSLVSAIPIKGIKMLVD